MKTLGTIPVCIIRTLTNFAKGYLAKPKGRYVSPFTYPGTEVTPDDMIIDALTDDVPRKMRAVTDSGALFCLLIPDELALSFAHRPGTVIYPMGVRVTRSDRLGETVSLSMVTNAPRDERAAEHGAIICDPYLFESLRIANERAETEAVKAAANMEIEDFIAAVHAGNEYKIYGDEYRARYYSGAYGFYGHAIELLPCVTDMLDTTPKPRSIAEALG